MSHEDPVNSDENAICVNLKKKKGRGEAKKPVLDMKRDVFRGSNKLQKIQEILEKSIKEKHRKLLELGVKVERKSI